MIVEEKKPHNIGEILIKLCMLKAAGPEFRKTYSKDFHARIIRSKLFFDEFAKDIECQVLKVFQTLFFFNSIRLNN